MQITRIKQIKDYRIFQHWKQPGNTDFARFNVIYGGNGSGKSTLASLLVELAGGDWSSGTRLVVTDDDGQNVREVKSLDEALMARLCIFNTGYVKQNLRFDNGETKSLLYLGKESIDIQKQREALERDIKDLETTLPQLDQEFKQKQKHRDKIATEYTPGYRWWAIRRKTFPAPSIRISVRITATRYVAIRHRSGSQANRIAC